MTDRQTDRQTDRRPGNNNMSPDPEGGDITQRHEKLPSRQRINIGKELI